MKKLPKSIEQFKKYAAKADKHFHEILQALCNSNSESKSVKKTRGRGKK